MGYVTGDGRHEGYLIPRFFDGERGTGTTGGGIPDAEVACGPGAQAEDGSWIQPTRPAGEVTGWVVCCDCSIGDSSRHTTWVGPIFTRVPSKAVENLAELRLYASNDEVAYVCERADVEEAVIDLWRSEHAFSQDALAEVEADAHAAAEAKQRLDASVAMALHGGASWAEIGRAAGVTGQSAHERWRGADGVGR
jgi:hypothetical protein